MNHLAAALLLAFVSMGCQSSTPEAPADDGDAPATDTGSGDEPNTPAPPPPPQPPGPALEVVSVSPGANEMAAADTTIEVQFDEPVDPETVSSASMWAFARWSGAVEGDLSVSEDGKTVTLTPDDALSAGESVTVVLSHDLASVDGLALRRAGYSFQFGVRSAPASAEFTVIDEQSTRVDRDDFSQAYGGIASDLDNDGWMDITVVNEFTENLAVLMNTADGSGQLRPRMTPMPEVGIRASPSEPSDFNRDGFTDICVANIGGGSVSILLGNGDGTFRPQQEIQTGRISRGIAVLDVDGDGDIDIVNTNVRDGTLVVLINDGSGVFTKGGSFDAGGTGGWALAAGDMDSDGILDLVVGASQSQDVHVARGNGDGSFTVVHSIDAGGAPWMLNVGDLNGDGAPDVAIANGDTNNGAILLNDGSGRLGAATTYEVDPRVYATDIGDLDGDGDADWVLSSFGGDWRWLRNDGSGTMSVVREFEATRAASCALIVDMDNDGDVDLGLIDELDDYVYILRNDD